MTDMPATQADLTPPPAQPPKKGFLRHAFNFVASAGVGAAVSISVKTAALAVFGTQLAALVPAAVGVGLASAAIQRGRDMYRWNKAHTDDKVGAKDFFKAAKTGHTGKDYLKRGALSGAFAIVGGLIGLGIDHWAHGASVVPTHTPAHPAPIPETVPPPVAVAPVPVPVPVHVPTPGENLANLLNEAKSQIPSHHCAGIDSAVHRLSSVHENVQAQAIKDLGYYYANGFCGVHENDVLADKLFQASLNVSHGHNIQALHDLGYQTLHGFGTAPDNGKAFELLTKAAAGGHPLSPPILDYMKLHHLAPAAR
jgi:TPR repeat protein